MQVRFKIRYTILILVNSISATKQIRQVHKIRCTSYEKSEDTNKKKDGNRSRTDNTIAKIKPDTQ